MYRFNEVDPDEVPKMTQKEIADELQTEDTALRNKYRGASKAVYYARRLSIYHDQRKPLEKLLVNSDTAIGSVYRPETTFRRLYSFAIYIALLGLSAYMSYMVVIVYFARESVFQINIADPENVTLPAITICNKNPIRKLPLCKQQKELIRRWNLTSVARKGLEDLCKPQRSSLTPETYRQMIPQLTEQEVLHEFGHDIADSLRGCLIKAQECYASYFTEVVDMEGGRCWCIFCNHTFDVENRIDQLKVYRRSSFGLGLVLLLDAEPEHHIDETSDGDGFLLKLHEPGEGSHPLFGSVNLPVGETTYVSITAKRIEREPGFLPDLCISDFPKTMYYADRSEKYELHACFEACQQKIISEVCQCIVADLYNLTIPMPKACPAVPPVTNDSRVVCDPTELIRDKWMRRYYDVDKCGYICSNKMQNFPTEFFGECSKMCRPNCQEILYHHSTSRTRWLATLKNLYSNDFLVSNKATQLAKVFVYYQTIEMEYLSGVPKTNYVETLVEVGGQLGNYLGLTALILFEICELIVRYICILYRRNRTAAAEARARMNPVEQAFLKKSRKADQMEASELDEDRKVLTNRLLSARRPVTFHRSIGQT